MIECDSCIHYPQNNICYSCAVLVGSGRGYGVHYLKKPTDAQGKTYKSTISSGDAFDLGVRRGREDLQHELRELLGIKPETE